MGATRIINTPNGVPLRIFFFSFFSFIFFGKMILPISLWLILSAVVVTARMDKPGGEIINNVDKAAASTEEGDKEIMQPALDRHRLRDMDWDTKDTGNERSSKKLSGQNMNKRMKHWPAAIQGASAVADELDEAKRESLAEKKEIKMADEEIEDEAESGEVDDAKSNKVALRQKNDCNNGRCPRCEKKITVRCSMNALTTAKDCKRMKTTLRLEFGIHAKKLANIIASARVRYWSVAYGPPIAAKANIPRLHINC